MEGHSGTAPLAEAPSYMRFIWEITLEFATRRIGGGGLTEVAQTKPAQTCQGKHVVDDPSSLLDYNWTRRVIWEKLSGLPWPPGFRLSPSNWDEFSPDTAASSIHQIVQANDDMGLCGGHYRFVVYTELKVTVVYSEPKALLRHLRQEVVQQAVVEPSTGDGDPACGICFDGLASSPPVKLPCGHAFHSDCIFKWFFNGTACPLCRHDLRGLVAMPWERKIWDLD
ncbi:hypothetical protein HU200_030820 [Digitaria exilis]|uniref:RING-type domain-containing protein n=1 Tax=Digitaria exilis TaxID=1010633 RepID=A0A835BR98_9POAL|nr:hypothetical protein HU200_030820 [Digitaria exilis]CAB3459361.1 unnamed protein product [Digitaria exilis]